ncbi:MAG: helix-turn-helix transcriptional regulator [Clostridia bacterium]|nr:helix-turn-helix transcriptional regulator [Clostridia bacterium]
MEFNEKLQELRKQKGLTQESLAKELFVSRTAVSKWESGRGYPNIESLKAISKLFGITVDELLSGEELLDISEEETRKKENNFRSLAFGLSDVGAAMLFFLPLFGQKKAELIQSVSLLSLSQTAPYLKISYYVVVIGIVVSGILNLALQNSEQEFWLRNKNRISLLMNIAGVFLFIMSQQPYAATFLLIFLIMKAAMLIKRQ